MSHIATSNSSAQTGTKEFWLKPPMYIPKKAEPACLCGSSDVEFVSGATLHPHDRELWYRGLWLCVLCRCLHINAGKRH